jgi:putative transposase
MSIRKVNFVAGEYYHIYNRGNSKQKIFHDTEDYLRFISLLYIANTTDKFNLYDIYRFTKFNIYDLEKNNTIVSIGAYCLMPNHFHILITENNQGGVSKFMQKLTTAYSMYYNKKYKRSGSLFEGKFKSEHAKNDRYLKYLFSYIHLNPVKLIDKDWKEKGVKDKQETLHYLNNYKYSSYIDYLEIQRDQKKILNTDSFPKYFRSKADFLKNIFEWLSYNQEA